MQRVTQGREPTLPTFNERDRLVEAISQLRHKPTISATQLFMLRCWEMKLRKGDRLSDGEYRNLSVMATIKGVEL